MRKTIICGLLAALVALLAISVHAAAKTYQFTGTVKAVSGNTFTVEKSAKETWEFSTDSSTKGTPKVGDRVTVYYRMVATEIEGKPAAAAAKKPGPAAKKK